MEVVSDFNLFLDSDQNVNGKGDNFNALLSSAGIQAGDGQFIRLSLQSFNAYKNFYNINGNNNQFKLVIDGTNISTFVIPPKNYKTIGDITTAWSTACATAIIAAIGGTSVVSLILPDVTSLMDDTNDRIMSATFTNSIASTTIIIQCLIANSDSYAIVGGDRITDSTNLTTSSMNITRTDSTHYTIFGKYPAQRSTEEHAYLRSDCISNNIEMTGLSAGLSASGQSGVLISDVLAKIPIDYEFINFNTQTGKEFILNIPNRTVNLIHFYITDSKGRTLGRNSGDSSSSGGSKQNTLGNLNCSFVVKIEIVQAFRPNKLVTEQPAQNPAFVKKSIVLNNMNHGEGAF